MNKFSSQLCVKYDKVGQLGVDALVIYLVDEKTFQANVKIAVPLMIKQFQIFKNLTWNDQLAQFESN